jgi:DNA mismatch repair ATPase MutS
MKAFLLYRDRDFDIQRTLPPNAPALVQDLELGTLWSAMALGDKFLFDVAQKVMLNSLTDLDAIRYRQDILRDCLKNASIIQELYALAIEAIEGERKNYLGLLTNYPSWVLSRSIEVLKMFVEILKKLRQFAGEHAARFESEGFTTFFTMLQRELSEDYLARVQEHLRALKFPHGALISAELGQGNKGSNYILRKLPDQKQNWVERIFAEKPTTYGFTIDDRDESGSRALSDLKDRGINLVANILAQSTDHVLSFFTMVKTELACYLGCMNLHSQLTRIGEPLCFPVPLAAGERRHAFQGLYDACLALTMKQKVVGNDLEASGKDLVIITGANQGGKSTFLRSIGLAQVMMQCGMFVPAESFSANVCTGLFTHYKRKEDASMRSGKLDEELSRMSAIVDTITPNAMVLLNESFAATNEREGSEIARQIVSALVERRVEVFFVTHLYEFAHGFYKQQKGNRLFLRADRQAGGRRTFKLIEGEPLQTSFGEDVYHKVFGTNALPGFS